MLYCPCLLNSYICIIDLVNAYSSTTNNFIFLGILNCDLGRE